MPENTLRQSLAKHLTMTACEGLQMERRSRRCAFGQARTFFPTIPMREKARPRPVLPVLTFSISASHAPLRPLSSRQPQGTKLYRRGEG